MSKYEFKLPDIGEGVTEGEIVGWLIKEGDTVSEDQEMVEVMTDKATVTIGAPKAGKVVELRGAVGDVVPVGDVLVVFELGGGEAGAKPEARSEQQPAAPAAAPAPQAPAQSASEASAEQGAVATAVGDIKEELPGTSGYQAPQAPSTGNGQTQYFNDKPLAAPATRKLARELGVDLRQVQPTGDAGRVTREDVERHARGAGAPAGAPAAPKAKAPAPLPPPQALAEDERKPIRGLRRRIFDNMARSKHTAAHFTYVEECEVSKLVELRNRTKPYAEAAQVKLSFLPFIVKATVIALKKHPALNCLVDDAAQEMILKKNYDIGIATATDAGLIVPVLRQADRLSILQIAGEVERLATDARAGKTRQEDVGGSTFTITSLGKLGGLFATPVVNYPEVAILGVHEMKKKPIIVDDEIVIGRVMLLSLSFDHRVIDGHVGAAFAQEIVGLLQEPDRLLVEMA